ncbi:G-patch domain and KOW motifs-containing protein [Battus philenor]|uniref:G-patch domain and KOW motifs-containing protein n=1 Tax=Battus philenor TaxID=42288 RepID=UPI0035D0EA8D
MENKKISFGFLKTKKQEKPLITEQREYIESVEENAIKIVGKEIIKEEKPLIIPMKPNTLATDRLKEIAEIVENSLNETDERDKSETNQNHPENETIDQMAVRELLQEAKQEKKIDQQILQIAVPANQMLEGQKESSLDDYEAVPIREFGMAMLRGMGWTPGNDKSKYKLPNLRPKGLGLGADKVVTENQKKNASKDNDKELVIVKNAYVKITTGKYSSCYGKVMSLDDDNGRVLVNIPIKNETVNLSEFMMQPVSKSEFDKQSKIINADAYEAYKNNDGSGTQKASRPNSTLQSSSSHRAKYTESPSRNDKEKYNNGRQKDAKRNQDLSSSEDDSYRNKNRRKKSYSSDDSLSSETDKKRKHKKQSRYSSSDSEKDVKRRHKSSSNKGKRDIDKKRKGKKKKRDRDRSPSHRKHKK